MKQSQYLRFIPNSPVLFSYSGSTDSMPVVLILQLLHTETNPGFLGINLNYVDLKYKDYLVKTVAKERAVSAAYGLKEYTLSFHLQNLCKGALRRYNYDKISNFYYRGAKQNHQSF